MQSLQSDKLSKALGDLIRQYRTLEESQAVFCQRLGVTRKTLSALEDGKGGKLATLCEALVILELDGVFVDLANDLIDDVSAGGLRKRKSKKQEIMDNDF
ncbi:MAG: DNA-binding XRE family transcriptional regulator [Alteromonadaceae bacterium]|jgi:DNA-binding XRE family transcriptional regulator